MGSEAIDALTNPQFTIITFKGGRLRRLHRLHHLRRCPCRHLYQPPPLPSSLSHAHCELLCQKRTIVIWVRNLKLKNNTYSLYHGNLFKMGSCYQLVHEPGHGFSFSELWGMTFQAN